MNRLAASAHCVENDPTRTSALGVDEIASITGHASLREITCYTKAADQKRLAVAAIAMGKVSGTSSVKPVVRFDTKRKKT
jgi:hypothetical protein